VFRHFERTQFFRQVLSVPDYATVDRSAWRGASSLQKKEIPTRFVQYAGGQSATFAGRLNRLKKSQLVRVRSIGRLSGHA
jgi:hypothetical protein